MYFKNIIGSIFCKPLLNQQLVFVKPYANYYFCGMT